MYITTSQNNKYFYSPRTNEILLGEQECCDVNFRFKDFTPFHELPNVDQFIINLTEQCNLRCTYCCYSGAYKQHRSHGITNLSDADIDATLQFIEKSTKKFPICISFYGGEPLLQYERLQNIILRSEQIWGDNAKFYVATNGVLLTHERTDWFVSHHVMLAISIDGTAEIHNRQRVTADGVGSYDKVYDALSYIKTRYPDYIKDNVLLLTTVVAFKDLAPLAEHWHNAPLLRDWAPTVLSSVAPNFAKGEEIVEWEEIKSKHETLLDLYDKHREWVILKTYFDGCIKYWVDRPVMDIGEKVPLSTCLPLTDKLFIDTHGNLHVCEKISNRFSIGNIYDGVDWEKANRLVKSYYDSRVQRCSHCPTIRMCSHCLTSIEFTEEQMDTLCHNERIYTRLNFWLFCEMVERRMVQTNLTD